MFKKVLIANRGEIALRVIRACRELGIATVAVHSTADSESLHVRFADEAVCIGPPPSKLSYLNVPALLAAAEITGADAIHPGYGFLSENPAFAEVVEKLGMQFIGPRSEMLRLMGNKVAAREAMEKAGLPLLPGARGVLKDLDEAERIAKEVGFPVILKAAAGGGGRGMKIVRDPAAVRKSFEGASAEALAAFGDGSMYLERYVEEPRHIELQIVADEHGNVIHLGERECSVQRRQQKVVEESPSCVLDDRMRQAMGEVAVRAAKAVQYRGAGTVEFLVDASRSFYFLEMNTRLQVEHPVTEMTTGLDLVRMQVEVARGERILGQEQVVRRGHAIEARIYAEDPARGFMPSPGKITYLRVPGGPGIRDDSGVYGGWVVPQYYDPMISKLVAWAPTREQAIERLIRALAEYTVHGITANVAFLSAVLDHPAFRSGDYDTGFCQKYAKELVRAPDGASEEVALVAAAVAAFKRDHDEAEALAARAGTAAGRSSWARFGRARVLRRGGR